MRDQSRAKHPAAIGAHDEEPWLKGRQAKIHHAEQAGLTKAKTLLIERCESGGHHRLGRWIWRRDRSTHRRRQGDREPGGQRATSRKTIPQEAPPSSRAKHRPYEVDIV